MRDTVEAWAGLIVAGVIAFFVGHLIWALVSPKTFWRWTSVYGVPAIMVGAWVFLAFSAETDSTGYSWMAVGFTFVAVLWALFRLAIRRAGLARALSTGDPNSVFKIASGRRRDAGVYRALAYEMKGDWNAVLAETAPSDPPSKLLVAFARAGALVELGDPAKARAELAAAPRAEQIRGALHSPAPILASLAEGRVRWAEGDLDAATPLLERTADDVRTGPYSRAEALLYLARIADAHGNPAVAKRHRDAASKLAPTSWVASA
jgi:hypothetical protein